MPKQLSGNICRKIAGNGLLSQYVFYFTAFTIPKEGNFAGLIVFILMKHLLLVTALFSLFFALPTAAKTTADDSVKVKKIKVKLPVRRSFIGSGMDGALFSRTDLKNGNSPVRFTYILNWGFTFNLNITRHLGVYTGIDVKNIGFIEQAGGITTKRRSYNIGAPVGIKIGNLALKKPYVFFGGGIDVPVNYREKSFAIRNQKTKFSEWFSERTPQTMPYMFLGLAVNRGATLKLQYYPGNFLNPNFQQNGQKPYANYDVQIQMLSLGIAVPIKRYHPGMRLIGDKDEKIQK